MPSLIALSRCCDCFVSDAHERLRQYLEQRRELGESEFVLDGLSTEDALKVLTAKAPMPPASAPSASRAPRGESSPPPRDSAPPPPPRDSAMRRAAEEAAASGDWREALRAVNASDDKAAPSSAPKPADAATPEPPADKPKIGGTAFPLPADASASGPPEGRIYEIGSGSARSSLSDITDLAGVAAAIATCTACSLSATAQNHVPGEGDPNARFVVVGEAPGQTEDELGRPFVGKSGDLLTKILEAIGFKREDVFICNVLKHRPPANRNPTPEEIVACRPFLLRQLELLEPKVILALGTFAAQTLLETDSPIGKLRGLEHRYHGIPLVATYHPAALLRNPNWKRPAWEDVQLARRIFDRP